MRSSWCDLAKAGTQRWILVLAALAFLLSIPACTMPDGGALDPEAGDAGTGRDREPTEPDPDPIDPDPVEPGARRIVAYFAAWSVYGRNFHVADIPADRITHINYAFANISSEGECILGDAYADVDKFYPGDSWDAGSLRGSFHQLQLLKQRHPHLRTLISVGGWTWSTQFSSAAASAASRERFARSCVNFMQRYGFDGIDIDWEYPVGGGLYSGRPEDRTNFTLLLAELRRQIDAAGGGLLTIAAPAGSSIIANLELAQIHRHLDFINVMTYDFHGSWDAATNFNAPLFASSSDPTPYGALWNIDGAVRQYLEGGVPASELVVGVPFYGRGWRGVGSANQGLYQAHGGVPQGTWEAGVFDYEDLVLNYVPRMQRFWHAEAQVPWLYDGATGVMITYDDPESMRAKASFIRERGLGGAMFWELSGDDASGSLLNALRQGL